MNKVLIVGASGYVGKVIAEKVGIQKQTILTYNTSQPNRKSFKFNLFNDDISKIICDPDIDTVIFAAMVEEKENQDLKDAMVRLANVFSSKRFVYLSSDAVFSGEKGLYHEINIPDANTFYGQNLQLCEVIIRNLCVNHCIIRPSHLYGYSRGNLDKRLSNTKNALLKGMKLKLYSDMYKSPMGVQQFAEALLSLSLSDFVGTIHIAGDRISIYEFHQKAMEALGVTTKNLYPIRMPEGCDLQKDTSLDITKWKMIARSKPLSIKESLS